MAAVTSKVDVQALSTADGEMKDERDKILASLKALDKQGVGVTPFLRPFFEVEGLAGSENNPKLKEAVTRLSKAVDEQEARSKSAKDFKPTGGKAEEKPAAAEAPAGTNKKVKTSRWASGASAMTDGEILADPDKAIDAQEQAMGGAQMAEKDRRFGTVLTHCYEVLNANNRSADAQKVLRRLNDLRTKNHWQ